MTTAWQFSRYSFTSCGSMDWDSLDQNMKKCETWRPAALSAPLCPDEEQMIAKTFFRGVGLD